MFYIYTKMSWNCKIDSKPFMDQLNKIHYKAYIYINYDQILLTAFNDTSSEWKYFFYKQIMCFKFCIILSFPPSIKLYKTGATQLKYKTVRQAWFQNSSPLFVCWDAWLGTISIMKCGSWRPHFFWAPTFLSSFSRKRAHL